MRGSVRRSSGAPSRRTARVSDDVAEMMRAVRRAASVARGVDARGRRAATSEARRLQHEVDTHRLFLLTSLAATPRDGESGLGIVERANEMTHDARAAAVSARLREEVAVMARAMRGGDRDDDARERERGASARWRELRSRALERVGHHCYVDASTAGEGAGEGLFVRGSARAGTVVASYPGLTYAGTARRYMNNYPRVGRDNAYLIERSDGSVIDAKPWGRGLGDESEAWPGPPVTLTAEEARAADAGSFIDRLLNPRLGSVRRARLEAECATLERANPFACAHFANHPPKGTYPNVVVASVDVPVDAVTRPFVPNVNIEPDEGAEETEGVFGILTDGTRTVSKRFQDASLAVFGEDGDKPKLVKTDALSMDFVRSLVLVATRDIDDGEEVWLNYRLSTHVSPPEWYTRVDPEEDERRWS